ncbi:hypothetical protein N7517_009260 [Penicillium concentricum]|uniref:Uncharacterized protein n=1 Tax=Penicillium concentricum TaxID=293559 RepID=A0A9W9UXA0_9EURO|nr:uncharacterized protein N7517_009260 [Penicillium concentricum]KAJ5360069.1 hypothetical protein N7517_009260 [Penicillium concentricum]
MCTLRRPRQSLSRLQSTHIHKSNATSLAKPGLIRGPNPGLGEIKKLPKRPAEPLDKKFLPKLKKDKYKAKAIIRDKSLTAVLDETELGKPLAEYVRDLADPERPTRLTQ